MNTDITDELVSAEWFKTEAAAFIGAPQRTASERLMARVHWAHAATRAAGEPNLDRHLSRREGGAIRGLGVYPKASVWGQHRRATHKMNAKGASFIWRTQLPRRAGQQAASNPVT